MLAPFLSSQYKIMGAQNMDKWSQVFAIGGTTLTLFLSNMIANASSSMKEKNGASNVFDEWGRKLKELFAFNVSFGKDAGGFDMNVPGSAAGRKTAGPMLSLIGEGAAPEYIIPTESRYRIRALELWQQAGKDLGVPMFAKGYFAKEQTAAEQNDKVSGKDLLLGLSSRRRQPDKAIQRIMDEYAQSPSKFNLNAFLSNDNVQSGLLGVTAVGAKHLLGDGAGDIVQYLAAILLILKGLSAKLAHSATTNIHIQNNANERDIEQILLNLGVIQGRTSF